MACACKGIRPRPPGGPCPGQSRRGQWPGRCVASPRPCLWMMREQQVSLGPRSGAISQFLKVTMSYWPGLFHCYDVADLPRTDNEMGAMLWLGALRGTACLGTASGTGRVSGARTCAGGDGLGFASLVLLTARTVSERS